jgi:hypothetical protein
MAIGSVGVVGSAAAANAQPAPALGVPSLSAATGTPQLAATGSAEQVRQIVQCGTRMYAVGTFTKISRAGVTYSRANAFSFAARAPYQVTAWHPRISGTVNSIAVVGKHCGRAYLGGEFRKVNRHRVSNLVEVGTARGVVVSRFTATANKPVETLLAWKRHLLTGGHFTKIDGSSRHPYFVSLSLARGRDDGYVSLRISGHYTYKNYLGRSTERSPTKIYNQQLSPNRRRLLVEGEFTSIGGRPRQQIAMLRLGPKTATTTRWHPVQFNEHCAVAKPFYAEDAAWSPTGSRIYVATSGGRPAGTPGSAAPELTAGMCDAGSAFSAAPRTVRDLWINYDGCDSLYSVAADRDLVFIAGHNRWVNNAHQCNNNNDGKALAAEGIAGLTPTNGQLAYNPGRSRGFGADDMLVTPQGLWIASDNFHGAQMCGGAKGHAGICLLPRVS